jgi:glycosyltransferase involved in cell wall biosynthesis
MKPAFIINNRNKGRYVYRCVAGALAQTVPCEIHVADFASTDNSRSEIDRAVAEAPRGADHMVRVTRKDEQTSATMRAVNLAIDWMVKEAQAEWVFQCSSDDYSLPDRVKVCMNAIAALGRNGKSCSGIATTMRFEDPENLGQVAISGYPTETGYVSAGLGLYKMAYGSTIWAYRRDFLQKVSLDVPCTLDVYLGFLAACDRGYYVICDPQHVHYMAHDLENIGFQGKMRAAEKSGDQATIHRLNELNRFQLLELYLHTKYRQQQLYPLAHKEDQEALVGMILDQAQGWYAERKKLHDNNISPATL